MKKCHTCLVLLCLLLAARAWAGFALDAAEFGATADGETDCTAALQRALDACAEQGGGIVHVPPGDYAVQGSLNIPDNVTLEGVFCAPTAWSQGKGTTLRAYAGKGEEDGVPFITLNLNATLKGLTIFYPEQTEKAVVPYPWTIAGAGKDNVTILDCLIVNPYQAIDLGTRPSGRHYVARVYGCPLRKGLYIDQCYDVGRIENVHFWPFYGAVHDREGAAGKFMQEHGEAFIFGRTDWQYVINTFCWGYKFGYHFTETEKGVCNGNFLGIGADACNVSVLVENAAPYGLLFTNGEFVAFPGTEPTQVVVSAKNRGVVQFNNCAFWGPCRQCARVEGKGFVSFNQCNFVEWSGDAPCISALSGQLTINACRFARPGPGVELGSEVTGAVVTANLFPGTGAVTVAPNVPAVIENNLELAPPAAVSSGPAVNDGGSSP